MSLLREMLEFSRDVLRALAIALPVAMLSLVILMLAGLLLWWFLVRIGLLR